MAHAVIEIVLWLFGLSIGSFLNVVVYRLPAGLAVSDPPRSFCPHCRATIAWYDNLPLLSWWLLGGRCRYCGAAISVQYPLVEGLTGLAFVLVYHLLFVEQCRADLGQTLLPTDLPLLLAWLALAAGLMACSAMDIVSYTVDVRVTNVVLGAGVLFHAGWPRGEFLEPRAQSVAVAAAVAAFLVSGVLLWWSVWRSAAEQATAEGESETPDATSAMAGSSATTYWAGRLVIVALVTLPAWLVGVAMARLRGAWSIAAIGVSLTAAFAATVVVGGQRRPADDEIRAAIEEEQPRARLTAWHELRWLSPAVLAAAVAVIAVLLVPSVRAAWEQATGWTPLGLFTPIGGAAFAIYGAIVGAAAGWLLRIVFTLAFGREAFGIGDIHILAAAGAAGGWDIALLGLVFSVGVALAGWLLGLLLKSTVMIPFGPWLALGFFLALWWNRAAHRIADSYRGNLAFAWAERPDLLLTAAGLLLVGTAAAIVLARLLRRWIAPEST